MFTPLSASSFATRPIKLDYIQPDRGFFQEFDPTLTDGVYMFQPELSAVHDFAINFDGINFLTDSRPKFSTEDRQSFLTKYLATPELDCGVSEQHNTNFWFTTPQHSVRRESFGFRCHDAISTYTIVADIVADQNYVDVVWPDGFVPLSVMIDDSIVPDDEGISYGNVRNDGRLYLVGHPDNSYSRGLVIQGIFNVESSTPDFFICSEFLQDIVVDVQTVTNPVPVGDVVVENWIDASLLSGDGISLRNYGVLSGVHINSIPDDTYSDAMVFNSIPVVEDAETHFTIEVNRYDIVLSQGYVTTPVDDTVFVLEAYIDRDVVGVDDGFQYNNRRNGGVFEFDGLPNDTYSEGLVVATVRKSPYTTCDFCVYDTVPVPLKNNFNENHDTTCSSDYREYTALNFGEQGVDAHKPELIFHTNRATTTYTESEFVFRLPDYSPPTTLIDINDLCGDSPTSACVSSFDGTELLSGDVWLSGGVFYYDLGGGVSGIAEYADFSCFGAVAGTCPDTADNILWDDGFAWLYGEGCDGVWLDRSYGISGSCLSGIPEIESVLYGDTFPSTLVLLSGTDYTYRRAQPTQVAPEDDTTGLFFQTLVISGDIIVDASTEGNDAQYVN